MARCKAEGDNASLCKHRGGRMGTVCRVKWLNTRQSTNGADRASRRLLTVEWGGGGGVRGVLNYRQLTETYGQSVC